MMKAGHIMTMTRNNGERRSRSFNAHSNRVSSPARAGSANYDNTDCSDVNFQSTNVLGLTTSEEERGFEGSLSKNISTRRQASAHSTTSPCSTRLASDIFLPSPPSSARSSSVRSDRLRKVSAVDRDYSDRLDNRFPRRCASARESSRERRINKFSSECTNFDYHQQRYTAPDHFHPLSPPEIITTIDDQQIISASDFERTGSSNHWTGHLLTVPSYESPPLLLSPPFDFQAATRSRSRSTPDSPESHQAIVDRKRLHHARSERDQLEDIDLNDMRSQHLLNQRRSNPEDGTHYPDRPPVDRRVSYDPSRDDDDAAVRAAHRDKTRKYSCADVRVPGDKTLTVPRGNGKGYQQQELRRMVSSETPRRRFLPPTPDELARQKEHPKTDDENFYPSTPNTTAYLDVNYGDTKKPYLLSSSSLPGRQPVQERGPVIHRQLSAATSGFLKDNETRPLPVREPISAANKPATKECEPIAARPGSGRKLPAEPPEANKTISFRIFRQNALADSQESSTGHEHRFRRSDGNMLSKSTSSEDEDTRTPSPAKLNLSSDSAKTIASGKTSTGKQTVFMKFHQSSVSSSSSVPDFQAGPAHRPTAGTGHETGATGGTDPATDSGHGSGAESALGDGTTVSASSSWPDAAQAEGKPVTGLDSLAPIDPIRRRSVITITPPLSPSACGIGLLHFTLQYFPVRKRLRVSIIKSELRVDAELNAFVKICLNPGKLQKQRGSRIVKRTSKEATFNEEFFFDNITLDDVETKTVYVRLCHHVGKQFQKDVVIGQMETTLKDFLPILLSKQEVKTCQELKPKQLKKLGRLQITTCLEKDARRLTINILKADDLPKVGITGPPDPFIRISVDQNGWVQTKQSRILKSTCNAVFKEAVMFLVSTRTDDLERTKIVITVHDAARSASIDDVIGHVYLGLLASDKTEMDQWRNSISHFGREFKATHHLKRESAENAEKTECDEDA